MHSAREPLFISQAPQDCRELRPLFVIDRGRDGSLVLTRDSCDPCHGLAARLGER
jgi:hypothetical protein